MNHRLALPSALLCLLLGGCASQQPVIDTEPAQRALEQRLTRLDGNSQSAQNLIGELGRKVEALSGELRRTQETVATQAALINRDQAARAGAASALARHIETSDKRLGDLTARVGEASAQIAGLKASVQESAGAARARIESLGAQLQLNDSTNALAAQAELAELAERIEASEDQLDELLAQAEETATLAGESQNALNEKVAAAEQQRQTDSVSLAARLTAIDQRLAEVARLAQDALDATGQGQRKIFGKVIDSILLTEDKTLFPINSPDLGDEDRAKLDALVPRLKALGTNYHVQIQGHTDGLGADDDNYALGKARAEVVKNYLSEKGGIPILRMSVMSYGALEATPGKSNRRIVIQVMQ